MQTVLTPLCFSCHHQSHATQQTWTLALNLDTLLCNSLKKLVTSSRLCQHLNKENCNRASWFSNTYDIVYIFNDSNPKGFLLSKVLVQLISLELSNQEV